MGPLQSSAPLHEMPTGELNVVGLELLYAENKGRGIQESEMDVMV